MKEIVLGMAHRGRLNVLSQVMAKPHRAIFHEFKGGSAAPDDVEGSGDVKYHLGASSDREFDGNKVHLSLTANPSHLEIVDPVVMGKARAKQDQLFGRTREEIVPLEERAKVLPLLLHGDAAFAGQGVIAEILGLSGLRGHRVAGTLHFIINNQIGFTTNPRFSRSSPYPSDVAKMIEAPIFHVNGDDPEAVVYAAKMATEFRMKFHKPVVVDMFCYRRFGHNEGDEPAFTQPIMYRKIRTQKTTAQIYGEQADRRRPDQPGRVRQDEGRLARPSRIGMGGRPDLQAEQGRLAGRRLVGPAHGRQPGRAQRRGKTAVPVKTLKEIGKKLTEVPKDFEVAQDDRPLPRRRAAGMIDSGEGIDWSTAEALAFGSILLDGNPVRLSGQDSERGTFSQRHSVLYDQRDETRYIPLNNLSAGAGRLRGHQLDAVGRGRARLRIRLFAGRAQRADAVGSAVRRFRQWRAGRVRPVHLRRASASGCACRASSACCRTAMKGRGRSIRRRGSSASCSFAPKTTCRSPTSPRRRTISTSCAGS